jgi:peptide/nickel transport system ATP-binding protein/oligopeptide transport system ATP-binding protein
VSAAAAASDRVVMQVQDLRVHFPLHGTGSSVKAVNGVSFDVTQGETLGVIGESGSGKTTLGRALVSLVKPTAGTILQGKVDPAALSSRDLRQHRRDYQIIFQDPNAALNPRMRILDSLMEPLQIAGRGDRAAMVRIAMDALARVGLAPEHAERYPHQFSGGQKQRIVIARALTLSPKVLVCDEVVAALDVSIRGEILNLFDRLQREFGLTYVFITHDLSVVSHISDRIAVMYLGCLMELGPAEVVAEEPLHPYTQALLSADPVPLPAHLRRSTRILLEGEIPSPVDPPSGCPFRTRCGHAQPACAQQRPRWREIRPAHWVACHRVAADGTLVDAALNAEPQS